MAFSKHYTILVDTNKVIPAASLSNDNPAKMLQTQRNLLGGIGARNATVAVYDSEDGTQATEYITYSGVKALGDFTPPTTATATCVINGVSFTSTFNTNANTTVDDLIALIEANVPTNALVAVTRVSSKLHVVAKAYGAQGNLITTTSNAANGASFAAATLTTGGPSGSQGTITVLGHAVSVSVTAGSTVLAAATEMAAQVNANAAVALLVDAVGTQATNDARITLTAKVPQPLLELGNGITLSATTGTEHGAALAGGVNSTANSYTF